MVFVTSFINSACFQSMCEDSVPHNILLIWTEYFVSRSFVDGHWGVFCLGTESVMICVYILGWTYVFILPEMHADSYHNCMFNLLKNIQTVFQGSCVPVTIVPVMCAVLTSLHSCNSNWCLPFGPRGMSAVSLLCFALPQVFHGIVCHLYTFEETFKHICSKYWVSVEVYTFYSALWRKDNLYDFQARLVYISSRPVKAMSCLNKTTKPQQPINT